MKTNHTIPASFAIALLCPAIFFFNSCLNPADEMLRVSGEQGKIVFVQEPSTANDRNIAMASHVDEFYPGTDLVSLSPISPTGVLVNLTQQYTRGSETDKNKWGAAVDPEISFDGKKILFAMRKQGSGHFHLFEMNVDGTNLVELTSPEQGDDMNPAYIDDNHFVFTSTRSQIVDEYERRVSPLLTIGERGSAGVLINIRQISFNQSHDINPWVHSSGKIIFSKWDHLGNPNKIPLFSLNPDGTGLFVYYGADAPTNSGSRTYLEARELRDGGIVSSLMERTSHGEGGAICIFDASKVTQPPTIITPSDAPFNNTMQDQVAAMEFKTPYPILDNGVEKLLVAMSPHPVGDRNGGTVVNYGLYVMDIDGKNLKRIYDNGDMNDYDPVVVQSRVVPKHFESELSVKDGLQSSASTGMFFDASVYSRMAVGDGQLKPDSTFINSDGSKGQAKYLRILEAIPLPVNGNIRGGEIGETNFEKQRVIGYGDIRADGSFSVEVPANHSLHMQTLDENGLMLVNQLQWIQVMPGERRMCTGCHGDRDKDKDISHLKINEAGHVVNIAASTEAVDKYLSSFANAQKVTEHAALRNDTVDFYNTKDSTKKFTNSLQAILDARCNTCHSLAKAATEGGNLLLEETIDTAIYNQRGTSTVYERLTKSGGYKTAKATSIEYASQNGARQSPLAWVLYNKQLNGSKDAFRLSSFDHSSLWEKDSTTSHINVFNTKNKDLLALVEWMDMGVQYSNRSGFHSARPR